MYREGSTMCIIDLRVCTDWKFLTVALNPCCFCFSVPTPVSPSKSVSTPSETGSQDSADGGAASRYPRNIRLCPHVLFQSHFRTFWCLLWCIKVWWTWLHIYVKGQEMSHTRVKEISQQLNMPRGCFWILVTYILSLFLSMVQQV